MIDKIIKSAAKNMKFHFDEISSNIHHNGEKGSIREDIVTDFLKKYIPDKYNIGTGIIIDSDGSQSKQQDIIIYDSFTSPLFLNSKSTIMVPIENVYATIEVKSTLNKIELEKSVNNIKSVRNLSKVTLKTQSTPSIGILFAYRADTSVESLLDNLVEFNSELSANERLSYICILDKGLIINISKLNLQERVIIPNENTTSAIMHGNSEENLMMFYLFLMQHLNNYKLSPPDLMKYAEKSDMLNLEATIPKEHIPKNMNYNFEGVNINVGKIISVSKELREFNESKQKVNFEEFKEFYSERIEKLVKLIKDINSGEFQNINFFNEKYSINQLKNIANICKDLKSGRPLNQEKRDQYENFFNEAYKSYKEKI